MNSLLLNHVHTKFHENPLIVIKWEHIDIVSVFPVKQTKEIPFAHRNQYFNIFTQLLRKS
jgi:hypothetical protein